MTVKIALAKTSRTPATLRLPRTLLLWWSLWLLASWTMSFGWSAPVVSSPKVYEYNVRNLLVLVTLGMTIVWPVFRLSTPPRRGPLLVTLLDYLAIMSTLQVVLWPMRLSGQWFTARIVILDLQLAAWGLLIAGVVAIATSDGVWHVRRVLRDHQITAGDISQVQDAGLSMRLMQRSILVRTLAMLACVVIAITGPVMFLVFGATSIPNLPDAKEVLVWSPISMAWDMSQRTFESPQESEWIRFTVILAAAVLLWSGAVLQGLADRWGSAAASSSP